MGIVDNGRKTIVHSRALDVVLLVGPLSVALVLGSSLASAQSNSEWGQRVKTAPAGQSVNPPAQQPAEVNRPELTFVPRRAGSGSQVIIGYDDGNRVVRSQNESIVIVPQEDGQAASSSVPPSAQDEYREPVRYYFTQEEKDRAVRYLRKVWRRYAGGEPLLNIRIDQWRFTCKHRGVYIEIEFPDVRDAEIVGVGSRWYVSVNYYDPGSQYDRHGVATFRTRAEAEECVRYLEVLKEGPLEIVYR